VESTQMAVEKLSLRRGEVLILVSDGVDGEKIRNMSGESPDGPLNDLAVRFLERSSGKEDDATVVLIRLRSTGLPTS